MTIKAKELPRKSPNDTDAGAVNFALELRSGELLTGTPTVAEQTTSALTISNAGLNSGSVEIAGQTAAANQAVTFSVAGGSSGTLYSLKVTCGTDSSPARSLNRLVDFYCE